MSLLSSADLHDLIAAGIVEAPHSAVQPASIDVTLDSIFKLERKPRLFQRKFVTTDGRMTPNFRTHNGSVLIPPNGFCIGSIREMIRLPNWLKCGFVLNSTAARSGLDHALAVWIDPGFEGRITVEFKNNLNYHNLLLRAGDRAGQLFFEFVEPGDSYNGRYQGDNGVQVPKVRKDCEERC